MLLRALVLAGHSRRCPLLHIMPQGCGRSEGKRGLRFFCESFDDYVEDVLQLARCVAGGCPWC